MGLQPSTLISAFFAYYAVNVVLMKFRSGEVAPNVEALWAH